jgi:anti-anti-sigma regulatory factor
VSITLEQSELQSVLRLEGAIDIASAAELKESLLKALGTASEVRVSLDGAADLDVTAVELLWAAGRKAKGIGVGFAFTGTVPEPVLSALREAGLQQFLVSVNAE